jgi:hypothetical protein
MKRKTGPLLVVLLWTVSLVCFGQQSYNLATVHQKKGITEVNRSINSFTKYANAVEMDAREGDGLGILKEIDFETGTIEVELLGENSPGKSFIGIAFNIEDKENFEAIYFRPFNFVATEQARKDHMVQYVYHPEYTWYKLRETRTMEFENEIPDPPDPNQWFNARIVVSEKKVEVFVETIAEPVLVVERLAESKSKKIGLWTGNGSSGRFRNLILSK